MKIFLSRIGQSVLGAIICILIYTMAYFLIKLDLPFVGAIITIFCYLLIPMLAALYSLSIASKDLLSTVLLSILNLYGLYYSYANILVYNSNLLGKVIIGIGIFLGFYQICNCISNNYKSNFNNNYF